MIVTVTVIVTGPVSMIVTVTVTVTVGGRVNVTVTGRLHLGYVSGSGSLELSVALLVSGTLLGCACKCEGDCWYGCEWGMHCVSASPPQFLTPGPLK